MRKIIPLIVKLSIVLMAVSVISNQVSATKGDVERALDLLKQARAAIGGESNIAAVQSMTIKGQPRRMVQLPEQPPRELNGEFEINMMLPDKFMRIEKLMLSGSPTEAAPAPGAEAQQPSDARVKIIRNIETADGQNERQTQDHAEIARYMLGLLLTPPAGLNAKYEYAGDGDVDGMRADVIAVQGANGFAMKLYLDKGTHLPLMMSYRDHPHRTPVWHGSQNGETSEGDKQVDVVVIRRPKGDADGDEKPTIIIKKDGEANNAPTGERQFQVIAPPTSEMIEIQVRFADFRAVNGVLLPHIITHYSDGKLDEIWTVVSYELNSPNINERFKQDMQPRWKQRVDSN